MIAARLPDMDVRAIVIGAGPAGACAASVLARELGPGSVLLVERSAWPRAKVCGCCLGRAGIDILSSNGLIQPGDLPSCQPLDAIEMRCGRRAATVALAGGIAIQRDHLDTALVQQATRHGAAFIASTSASVIGREHNRWNVTLTSGALTRVCRAHLVIVADGLAGRALDNIAGMHVRPARRSRMGVSTVVDIRRVSADAIPGRGLVRMHVAGTGYVGTVRLADGNVAIAAALDPHAIKHLGGPQPAMEAIVASCGTESLLVPDAGAEPVRTMGSGLLTRRRSRLAIPGLLVVGDSAGYVEPFTGEGMTWAIASGVRAAQIAVSGLLRSDMEAIAATWTREHERMVRRRQLVCRATRWLVRKPAIVSGVLGAMRRSGPLTQSAEALARAIAAGYGSGRPSSHVCAKGAP